MSDPSPTRSAVARTISLRGPKFFRDGEDRRRIMFAFNYDGFTREGPREATEADALEHAGAYAAFLRDDETGETQIGPPDKSGKPTVIEPPPMRPLIAFTDPAGGAPAREPGPYERRRNEAYARGARA